jgi:hypothetical protein
MDKGRQHALELDVTQSEKGERQPDDRRCRNADTAGSSGEALPA